VQQEISTVPKAPVVGAALQSNELAQYLPWLLERGRDLEIQDAINPGFLDGDWRRCGAELADLLEDYPGRVGIHGPFLSLTVMAHDPAVRTIVQQRMLTALDFGEMFNATHMVIHSPFSFFGNLFHDPAWAYGLSEQIDLCRQTLDPILDRLEQNDCSLVIEPIYDRHPGPLLALVDAFQSENVGMSLDVGHAFVTHQMGGPAPDQWVWEAGARLAHLHLHDTDGTRDRHWPPGHGSVNWYALFEALSSLNTQPRLILELIDKTDLEHAATRLMQAGYVR
jgi:sugar phosphate isomerase/epimerase